MLKKITNYIFLLFFVRRAARFLCRNFSLLGLDADKIMLLASPGPRVGMLIVSGLTVPKFEYDLWLDDGWRQFKAIVYPDCIDLLETRNLERAPTVEFDSVGFSDRRVSPVVEVLKTTAFGYFPFHNTAGFKREELQQRLPPWKG